MRTLLILLACASCDPALVTQLDIVTANDVAGTYTGILEGVSVSTLDDLGDPQRQVIVHLDLLHQLSIRETGTLTVRIQSSGIPPLRAIVVGSGPVAINAEFVEFEGQFDAYNHFNSRVLLTRVQTFGSALHRPATNLQARLIRQRFQMRS